MPWDNTPPQVIALPGVTALDTIPELIQLETQATSTSEGSNLYSDGFAGTDAATLASPWALAAGHSVLPTYQTGKSVTPGGPPSGAVVSTQVVADAYCKIKTYGDNTDHHQLIAREQAAGSYYVDLTSASGVGLNTLTLTRKRNSPSENMVLAGPVAVAFVSGATLKLQIVGNQIRVSYNGVELIVHTESPTDPKALLAAGKWGFSSLTSAAAFDDFVLGNVTGAVSAVITLPGVSFDNTAPQLIPPP